MIDLHLHTTASDGLLTPEALVTRARAAGLTIISVTDHDTTAGLPEASTAAARLGVRLINGIEITAVERSRDVHVLGYFLDPHNPPLSEFLRGQRADRLRRLRTMQARLRELGHVVDLEDVFASAARDGGRAVGRPQLADALVAAGVAADCREAFETLLGEGRPAFVPRTGASVSEVTAMVQAAGGITSLAHPAVLRSDDRIPEFVEGGLSAIEVWHSDHDEHTSARYRLLAERLGIGMSGGSDYHGDHSHHAADLGSISLPPAAFADLEARSDRHAPSFRSR